MNCFAGEPPRKSQEPEGYVTLSCNRCEQLFAVWHPTLDDVQEPVCTSCREERDEYEYDLSRGD